ncbi:MAG: MoxR family ATPase [Candidatus Altiarchaeota archaeon]
MKVGTSVWDSKEDEEPKKDLGEVYEHMNETYKRVIEEAGKVVVGQRDVIEQILIAIFSDNHALIEGFPGLGKTLMVKTLSQVMNLSFGRIQCTPDLMPSDITGTYIVEEDAGGRKKFRFEKGPVFTNILLADEINRATPKAQSALLESMQERQVTMGLETHLLEKPFLVLATQNPIEMEGTYPLPEAQVDRFLLKIIVDYPELADEQKIMDRYTIESLPSVNRVIDKDVILSIQELTRKMPISTEVRDYALNIVSATRPGPKKATATKYLDFGASPRASIGLVLGSKARALINGRNFVSKKDVEAMAFPILRHRVILNFESERKGMVTDDIIEEILEGVEA